MLTTGIYHWLRANGDVFVAISLAGCLVVTDWAIIVLSVYLLLIILSSRFRSIWQSIVNYNSEFFRTKTGIYYNTKLTFLAPFFFLLIYHDDGFSGIETPLKSLLVAYVIVFNIDRFRWSVLVQGAAVGAIAAFVFGLFQVGPHAIDRSAGGTSLVRFGMIAMALASVCAVGVVHSRSNRLTVSLALGGFLAGIGAALVSGSRGALLALPFVLALLVPVLWRRSKRIFVTATLVIVVFVGGLLAANVGNMATRIGHVFSNISAPLAEGSSDRSVGDRTKLLILAYQLFEEHPVLGVGARGWTAAIRKVYEETPDPRDWIRMPYNQAHNQYADDLAKGGIVRFLLNFVLLFLPLYLFLKREPYSGESESQFALAGVVVSVAFMLFCLTESLMILSLSASVHAALIFSLLAAGEQADRRVQTAH
jgi:O-antigen ligase